MKKIESSTLFIGLIILILGIGLEVLFQWQLLVMLAIGIFLLFSSRKTELPKRKQRNRLFLAAVFILIAVLLTSTFKIGLVVVGIFAIFHYISRKRAPELVMLETCEPESKTDKANHFIRNQWFGNQRVLDVVYEWEDINVQTGIGDTIIDLGNTVLPTGESIIMIRGLSGKIRLLVPFDIGICLEHSAIFGKLQYDKESTTMQNNTVKIYSDNYDDAARKIKIVTSVVFGDLEVIRL
ncbi:cell wall-active antibiotics response protein LiaF [Listeria fleischmannii]|uniref:YvqF protein n=1 Tax=Listeria fleischmannii FSL S10-1203 TaxID=1265822 RepID=W7DLV4_9LIST|nr:cell wall-active antibiotics response protein LiaF [Listeria fleischmannii]EIA19984.1 lia operon protein LiaF [Listeria fleischmannii subsp. coloradonensis]EUJ55185.1 YvqF protein [Listeria fleischmannii FSL S10-1203]MBC1419481.1 cell wall-active antibiotics response protein [Listeria fleischmannii]STY35433.1 Predicted membrane protein [Listeria fleischmannii subsp. coloradonensis]